MDVVGDVEMEGGYLVGKEIYLVQEGTVHVLLITESNLESKRCCIDAT